MSERRAGWWRSTCVLILALAVVVTVPASAQAALVGLERAGGATGFSSANKSFTATCPAGKRVVGVGADIGHGGGAGQVVMTAVTPNAALTAMTASVAEDENGTPASWSLGGTAICATPVPGLERIAVQSATNSANGKTATAACPAGKRLLGAGGDIVGAPGQVEMDDIIPNASLTSVNVRGLEDQNGTAATWHVTAYAICANPVAGLQRVVATSATNSADGKFATATCPAGKLVTGVGGDIVGGAGQVVMDDFIPFPNPATSVQVVGNEDETGTTANWSVTAYAICANSAERVEAQGGNSFDGHTFATATCPAGKQVTGAGHEIIGARGQVAIHELTPDPSPPTNVLALGIQDDDGFDGGFIVSAYAICATPLPGLTLVPASTISDSNDKSVMAICPPGKKVVGVGGKVTGGFTFFGGTPPNFFGEVVMDGLVPNAALTSVTVRASEDEDGFAEDWSLTAYAICANPPPGLQRVSASSPIDPDVARVTASCPAGKNLLGTGGEIFASKGQVIDDLLPDKQLRSVTVTGIQQSGIPPHWSVNAFAICANP
jgi:hypothetical protein